ncbi:MAG: glycosyltransferase family 2 protein [Candidatus Nealsonbacteria bacterium]
MIFSIIIPIYNEKNTIKQLLEKIEAVDLSEFNCNKEVVLVDDASTDGTKEVLKSLPEKYKVIYHTQNKGKGAAIQTGLAVITGDYVIIQDADLEYDPQDYKIIMKCVLDNNAQVVYGSRPLKAKGRAYKPLNSSYYWGGIFLNYATRFLYRINITDESTCYKLFKTELIKSIPLNSQRFGFCPEVTAKIAKRGIKIHEVPISYTPRHKKEGKKIKWIDGVEALWILIKYKFVD